MFTWSSPLPRRRHQGRRRSDLRRRNLPEQTGHVEIGRRVWRRRRRRQGHHRPDEQKRGFMPL